MRLGCLVRAAGGLGLVCAVVAAGLLLPGSQTRRIRSGLAPGMSVEEVTERANGWLYCRAYADAAGTRVVDLLVWPSSYTEVGSETRHAFATRTEMARALAAEMRRHEVEWRMTFGYTTAVPRRIYFDVDFSPDGRVQRVSATRWGPLD